MFKRELRLAFEDYAIYRARLGDEPANLTYDRGLMVGLDVLGFGLTGQLLNGNGIGPTDEERRFDDNDFKTLAGHITRDLTSGARIGVFGYYGRSESEGFANRVTVLGGDATFGRGAFELNLQYLHREDSNPLFATPPQEARTDGGFVEALFRPGTSRWHGFALYNLVQASNAVLDVRLGGPPDVTRYETVTGGLGYLLLRNLKLSGETTWDLEQERVRWTVGFVTAF